MLLHRFRNVSSASTRELSSASNHRHRFRPLPEALEGRLLLAADVLIRTASATLADRLLIPGRSHAPSLSQPKMLRFAAPEVTVSSAKHSQQDFSPASREKQLMTYARNLRSQIKANPQSLTDAQALSMVISKAISLQNPVLPDADRIGQAVDDLGDVIGGGIPFGNSPYNYAKKGGSFHDSGFASQYQDGGDQVRHFIGGFWLGYWHGNRAVANAMANGREKFERFFGRFGFMKGYSAADINLNRVSTKLGDLLRENPALIDGLPSAVEQLIEPPASEPPPSTSSYSDLPVPLLGTWSGNYNIQADETNLGSLTFPSYSGTLSVSINSVTPEPASQTHPIEIWDTVTSATIKISNFGNQTLTFSASGGNVRNDYENIGSNYDDTQFGMGFSLDDIYAPSTVVDLVDIVSIEGEWATDTAGNVDPSRIYLTYIDLTVYTPEASFTCQYEPSDPQGINGIQLYA